MAENLTEKAPKKSKAPEKIEPIAKSAAFTPSARLSVQKTYKLYIGGQFPRTESGHYLPATNYKGEFVANICRASRKDFRNAVVVARAAQSGWAGRSPFNRGQILYRMAEMLEGRRAGFEGILVKQAGYQQAAAESEVSAAIDRLLWYAGFADKFVQLFSTTNPVASAHFNFTMPEATGVVAILTSPNAPLLGLISAMAPVIVSGNTTVIVVDSATPTIAMEFAEILAVSDLPGGVVNILTGLRGELVKHIGSHMDVDGIFSFGSSDDERRVIGIEAAESVKRVKFIDDVSAEQWTGSNMQSPQWIVPFVEFKTAWHPMGS